VQVQGPVVTQAELARGQTLVTVAAPELARLSAPGQFAMLRRPGRWDPYLRTALPFLRCGEDTVSFLMEGEERLALGDTLDLIGPLGHGFALGAGVRRLLLIAAGGPAAPLLALADRLLAADAQASVTLVCTAALARDLAPLFAPAVEVITAPAPSREAVRLLPWADLTAVSGPREGLRTLSDALPVRRAGCVQCYLPLALGCGLGWCGSCLTETQRGPRRGCVGGPVFDLMELT